MPAIVLLSAAEEAFGVIRLQGLRGGIAEASNAVARNLKEMSNEQSGETREMVLRKLSRPRTGPKYINETR